MSKVVKWFKLGEEIPDNSRYIKSKTERENFKWVDCDCPTQLNCNCHTVDYVDYFLYEIPAQPKEGNE